jgi:hypothetical protein
VTRVFSLEAMATCEQRGHSFAWVSTWHDVGFDECSRCGLTLGARSASPGILPGAKVDAPDHVADAGEMVASPPAYHCVPATTEAPRYASATPAAPSQPRNAAMAQRDEQIRLRIAAGESHRAVAAAYGIHQTRVTQILRGGAPAKGRPENAARDAEVRRRMAAGESAASIAVRFGISQQRVYQIAPARRAEGD